VNQGPLKHAPPAADALRVFCAKCQVVATVSAADLAGSDFGRILLAFHFPSLV
jgi:hypothetical protein